MIVHHTRAPLGPVAFIWKRHAPPQQAPNGNSDRLKLPRGIPLRLKLNSPIARPRLEIGTSRSSSTLLPKKANYKISLTRLD